MRLYTAVTIVLLGLAAPPAQPAQQVTEIPKASCDQNRLIELEATHSRAHYAWWDKLQEPGSEEREKISRDAFYAHTRCRLSLDPMWLKKK